MWQAGETIVRREVRNDGWVWLEIPVVVVRDDPDLLATYVPSGAPFTFPPGPEVHPWAGRELLAGPRRADAAAPGRQLRGLGVLARRWSASSGAGT